MEPLHLHPKGGLGIMNGTAVMTAVACLAYDRAGYLAKLATRITSMVSDALKGNTNHFDERLFAVEPQPGQNQIAAWIRSDLRMDQVARRRDQVQERCSWCCDPLNISV